MITVIKPTQSRLNRYYNTPRIKEVPKLQFFTVTKVYHESQLFGLGYLNSKQFLLTDGTKVVGYVSDGRDVDFSYLY